MSAYVLPVAYTLFVWWFSTGLILYLDGLPRHTFRRSWLCATAIAIAALYGLAITRNTTTAGAAYCAFTCAVLVWGWLEMGFLMGFVTGPRRTACPAGCAEWLRLGYAIQAILHHEIALIGSAVAVVAFTWGGANQVGSWTFLVLWIMRQSAKLNLYLGVRNLSEEFLPEHLRYLQSFFRRRSMNLLFPVSVTASTMLGALLWQNALSDGAGSFDVAGLTLVATILSLAILEHWFLVVPLPATALWNWSLRSRDRGDANAGMQTGMKPIHAINNFELAPPVELAVQRSSALPLQGKNP